MTKNNFAKMDITAGSGNDEYYTPEYAITPLLNYLPYPTHKIVIWCPFDTDESNFVKVFRQKGYIVIATHLSQGKDFFDEQNIPECDYIISNPPYSMKGKVFERLFRIGKPFAMLVGIAGLFESQHRFNLFKNNSFELMLFNLRVSYFKSYVDQKEKVNPPYSSVYVCSQILPDRIVFEIVNKNTPIPPNAKASGILGGDL